MALRAGFDPSRIVFTGVGKTSAELERAIVLGVKTINAESPGELAADRGHRPGARHHAPAWRCASTPTSTRAATRTSRPGSGPTSSACPSSRRGRSSARPRDGRAAAGRRPRPRGLADHVARSPHQRCRAASSRSSHDLLTPTAWRWTTWISVAASASPTTDRAFPSLTRVCRRDRGGASRAPGSPSCSSRDARWWAPRACSSRAWWT